MFKKAVLACGIWLVAATVFAALSKEEVERLNNAAAIVTELRNAPDKGIPEDLWSRAECVIVIPSMKKAAFVVGGEYGAGVMSCKKGNTWSAPVFMQLAKGSLGLQIGAEQVDLVLLVMNRRGVEKLLGDKVALGADASVAAGPVGRTANAATDAKLTAEMLSYSRSQGVFAGIDLSGGVLRPDKDANAHAYAEGITPKQVVEGTAHVTVPTEARAFLGALKGDARATAGRKS